jgi:poly-gamma-glutamate synthesis protein (capsule biosynthesis protein)
MKWKLSAAFIITLLFASCAGAPDMVTPPSGTKPTPEATIPAGTEGAPEAAPPAAPEAAPSSGPGPTPEVVTPAGPEPAAAAPGSVVLLPHIPEQPAPASMPEPDPSYLSMVAVGDNLIHIQIIQSSRVPPGASGASGGASPDSEIEYDFSPLYQYVKPAVQAADLAFINVETLFAGKQFGYTGYPQFNAPQEMGLALSGAGFDVVNHATNHIMDAGETAVFMQMAYWSAVEGVRFLGIHPSNLSPRSVVIEKNGIKIGFLSYTYGTNGLPTPRDKPWLVSLIDTGVMAREIDALRPICDFLIVSMHWGNEYETTQNARQIELANLLAAHSVDLVIGHHPHVLQPAAWIPRPDGGRMLCYYSLGNFVSAQNQSLAVLLGGMMRITLKKDASGVSIIQSSLEPLVTHYERGYTGFRVYPLSDYTADLATRHGAKESFPQLSPAAFASLFKEITGVAPGE